LTPPLVGWVFMDSVMLGSLHTYRRWIKSGTGQETLSLFGHGCAGAMAGFTVSFVAAPIEHVKAVPRRYFTNDRHDYKYNTRLKIVSTLARLTPIPKSYVPRATVLTYYSSNLTGSGVSIKASLPPSSSAQPSLSGGQPTNSTLVSSNHTLHSPSPA
jgi:hypothetical protein